MTRAEEFFEDQLARMGGMAAAVAGEDTAEKCNLFAGLAQLAREVEELHREVRRIGQLLESR